jgi:hypothetical protein
MYYSLGAVGGKQTGRSLIPGFDLPKQASALAYIFVVTANRNTSWLDQPAFCV